VGEISIRRLEPEDVPEVLEVLRRALGETPLLKRTPELWAWKHVNNPFGPSLGVVAESEGRIAGVRALMRWDLRTPSGEVLRCLRPVDTATDPDFARRGIFTTLTEAAVDQATQDGFDLIFNTPNQSSGPGYLKMGWNAVGPIGVMARPLLRRGAPPPTNALPDPDSFFDRDLVEPSTALDRAPRGLRTPRTDDYVAWRFTAHPTARYRSVEQDGATAVLRPNVRSGRKELVISDLLGDARASLVRRVARRARAAYLAAWFSPGSPERRAAVAGGVLPIPGMRSLTLMARPLRDLSLDVFDLSNWDISMGDLELL
jgi:hypothetical protein